MAKSSTSPDLDAIRAEGSKLAPWHLGVEIAPGLTTADLREPDESKPFYEPAPMLGGWFKSLYPDGLQGRSAFDCACNNGAFLFALKELGAGRCFGSDVRQLWIDQARFLLKHRQKPSDDMQFEVADLYELPDRGLEPFDIGIFAGVLYHLPDPILGLRIAADLTKEVLYVSTATRGNQRDGLLVAVEESITDERSGVHGLAFFPTGPRVLTRILAWMGFPAVRCLNWWHPPDGPADLDSVQLVAAREERFLEGLDRQRPAGHAGMLRHIQERTRPSGPILVMAPEGDRALDVPHREVWQFPAPRPAMEATQLSEPDTRSLITELDEFWAGGAEYLVVPSSAFAWLGGYPELRSYLDLRYTATVRDPRSCILYDLSS